MIKVAYTWDNANRLTQIVQSSGMGSATVSIGYDYASRRTSVTLPNGVLGCYYYDNASELVNLSYLPSGSCPATAPSAGTLGTLTYGYDNAGRVSSRGGTLFQSVLPAAVTSGTYDAANRLTSWVTPGGGASPAYDANGNLINDGTRALTWDARNRLTGVFGGASYVYDGADRRQSVTSGGTTVAYLQDGVNPVQEQSGGAVLANLLTGLGIDERFTRAESAATNFLTDGLGSTMAMTNASGAIQIQTSYGYDPYGVTSVSGAVNDNPYQFTGRQNDASGLYYYRGRYYNPAWGRFISQDPIGFTGGDVNLYHYVGGNPINYRDPLGLCQMAAGGDDDRCDFFGRVGHLCLYQCEKTGHFVTHPPLEDGSCPDWVDEGYGTTPWGDPSLRNQLPPGCLFCHRAPA